MRSNGRLLIIVAVALVVILAGLFGLRKAGVIGGTKAKKVLFSEVKKETITETVSASGKVQPEDEVRLSPDVSGEIREIYIEEGDSVRAGQLLLKLRPDNFQSALERSEAALNSQKANVSQTEARLAQAQARLTQAEQEYNRNKSLFDRKVISAQDWNVIESNYASSKADYEAAKQTVEAARYTVKSSEASVREAKENLSLTSVHAPMAGIVTRLAVEKGERVVGTQTMTGTEMLRIANLKSMEVRVNVNENDIIRVAKNDKVIIDVDAYSYKDVKFDGKVTAIANSANESAGISESVTEFEVRIRIDPASYLSLMKEQGFFPFRPGMTASVDVITEEKPNALSVPLSAVTTRAPKNNRRGRGNEEEEDKTSMATNSDDIKEVVFVVEADTVRMVEVKTGISDFDNIEILSGLEEGAKVVEGPFLMVSKMLSEGDKVEEMKSRSKKKD